MIARTQEPITSQDVLDSDQFLDQLRQLISSKRIQLNLNILNQRPVQLQQTKSYVIVNEKTVSSLITSKSRMASLQSSKQDNLSDCFQNLLSFAVLPIGQLSLPDRRLSQSIKAANTGIRSRSKLKPTSECQSPVQTANIVSELSFREVEVGIVEIYDNAQHSRAGSIPIQQSTPQPRTSLQIGAKAFAVSNCGFLKQLRKDVDERMQARDNRIHTVRAQII